MEKLLVGSARHLESEGGLRDLEYLLYNLPFRCNNACDICCNQDRVQPTEQLSETELYKVVKEATGLGIRVFASMGQGEPLISDNFEFLIRSAHQSGLIPYIFTNASDLDEPKANFLAENKTSLIIHLDSLDRERYHQLYRGGSDLAKVLTNIHYARKLFARQDNLTSLAINMVVRKQNVDEVGRLAEFCQEDIAFVTNTLIDRTSPDYLSNEQITEQTGIQTIPLGTGKSGFCEYLNRGITIQGRDVLVCPYSDIIVGGIQSGGLTPHIGKARKLVSDFYAEQGEARCFVRHPDIKVYGILGEKHD